MKLKHLFVLFAVMASAMATAFIEKKPEGKAFIPEESEASIATKQVHNGTHGVVGEVPKDTTPGKAAAPGTQPEARSALDTVANPQQVLEEGSKRVGEKPKSHNIGLWAFIVATMGFGCVMAVRHWANKAIPPMPGSGRSRF